MVAGTAGRTAVAAVAGEAPLARLYEMSRNAAEPSPNCTKPVPGAKNQNVFDPPLSVALISMQWSKRPAGVVTVLSLDTTESLPVTLDQGFPSPTPKSK